MKKICLVLLLSIGIGFAQPSASYYNAATSTGLTLKTQLYNIIKGHADNGYNGLYTTYQTSDRDYFYENDGTILDMYSENPTGADPYNYSSGSAQRCGNYSAEGDCYNREHIIPQSTFNSSAPMVSDAHFITPTDGKVNGIRSNYPHGVVGVASIVTQNGSKLGSATNSGYAAGYSGTVFEPINEFKGDIARMYFYFATRYQNTVGAYPYAMFTSGNTGEVFTTAFKNILVTWHNQDPVSAREIARNNAVFARQGNRNPYIDHPEYIAMIWPTTLATDSFNSMATVSVYPNPTSDNKINIETETELTEIDLITINGQLIQQIKNPVAQNKIYSLENLPKGFYFMKLSSINQTITKKIKIN